MRAALLLVLTFSPLAALGQTLSLPAGCTAAVTVQQADCRVAHYMSCSSDPAGHSRVFTMFDDGGPLASHQDILVDPMGQILRIDWLQAGWRLDLDGTPADPVDIAALLRKGADAFDYRLRDEVGAVTRSWGQYRLNGATFELAGQTLQGADYVATVADQSGNVVWTDSGNVWVSAHWNAILLGRANYVYPDGTTAMFESSPVSASLPGEAGFLAATAPDGCIESMGS